jgi:hypothetical protein
MALNDDMLLFCVSLGIYLVLAITWNFKLFSAKEKNDENNIIKVLIVWLLLFVQPLIVQFSLVIADSLSRGANIITLFELYYQITIWIAWIISIYFMIFFGYNILLWLSNVIGGKK